MSGKTITNALLTGKWIFILLIIFLFVAIWSEKKTENRHYTRENIKSFQKGLNTKEIRLEGIMKDLLSNSDSVSREKFISGNILRFTELFENEGIGIFLYDKDSLIFWSDNYISVPTLSTGFSDDVFLKLSNSYYVKKEISKGNIKVIGLILIKTDYPYENRFIKSGFRKEFDFSKNVRLVTDSIDFGAITDINRNFLFSVVTDMIIKWNEKERTVCIVLYLIAFILFLFFIRKCFKELIQQNQGILIVPLVILMAGIYLLLHFFRMPEIVFNLVLFSPEIFARSAIIPSLGDLFILTVFIFFVIYIFYMDVEPNYQKVKKSSWLRFIILIFFGALILLLYWFTFSSFKSLILDSTINFQVFKVLDLSVYTFIGLLILGFLFMAMVMLFDKVLTGLKKMHLKNDAFLFVLILNANVFALLIPSVISISPESAVFFLIISIFLVYLRFRPGFKFKFSNYIPFLLLFSIFTVIEVVKFSANKGKEDMEIKAVNLSTEHDPVAELLFVDIEKRLSNDEDLKELMFSGNVNAYQVLSLLKRKYFGGYWDKYDLQITTCEPSDSVYVLPPVDRKYNCYDYFNINILEDGIPVPNSNFYYLDNLNGRISYFASMIFEKENLHNTLFIELDTRLISEGLGYPELLLDEKVQSPVSTNQYSYAKYNKGRLISYSGNFPYYMTSIIYTDGKEGFSFIRKDKSDHLIYNLDSENTIIISKPAVFWVDIVISFSYIFAFYFLVLILLLLISNRNPFPLKLNWNFKNKIQIGITSLLLFSLLFIGTATVYFSIHQYWNKHIEILDEKMQSIYSELVHNLEFENDLHNWSSEEYYNLNSLLERLSNVFYTDINLYDNSGRLIATSRPEIFDKGLIAPRMNSSAFREMVINQRSEFILNENIGDLTYLSSYVPFVNSENNLLAYLNLPYFTRQDELKREITNLVVAIINIIVLLSLLSFTVAVFMSNTITQPLRMIQEKFALISLRRKNEKIDYGLNDEIGSLIKAYNEMVDQLDKSADMLAKSERELAWREMAKQIAHEIKNPLTPMRLSIQHLQRTWNDKSEDRDQQIERLSKTIIDQIDNLSAIATEFSNFAKMPQTNNEMLNMVDLLSDTMGLFDTTENVELSLNLNGLSEVYVFADKEQLSRVFINLLKNAIQACVEGRESKVEISLYTTSEKVIVKVRDNGKGIPEEIQDKMFQPNFTTKSSGMGMGLAIVKSIVKNTGGEIFYSTEVNKGSVFTVEIPLFKSDN